MAGGNLERHGRLVDLIKETEGQPASRPALAAGLFTEITNPDDGGALTELNDLAQDVDLDPVWQRIEAWIAHRWGVRSVEWIVGGPGVWEPRLAPATITTAERWDGSAWETITLTPAPVGFELEAAHYRVAADVGDTDPAPAAVQEAVRRLATYQASTWGADAGITNEGGDMGATRPASWAARGMIYSGAADLLRPWRTA